MINTIVAVLIRDSYILERNFMNSKTKYRQTVRLLVYISNGTTFRKKYRFHGTLHLIIHLDQV